LRSARPTKADKADVDKWVDGRSARKVTMAVVTKGIHVGVHDFIAAVEAVKSAVADLAKSSR